MCGGTADAHCVYNPDYEVCGVVCGGTADVVVINVTPPEQPTTIRCFKFRPRERAYICCTLQPVMIISALSLGENCNIYIVNKAGQLYRVPESELCTSSEAKDKQRELSILYEMRASQLENTPIKPDPLPGKVQIEVPQPVIVSGATIREKALRQVDKLKAIKASLVDS